GRCDIDAHRRKVHSHEPPLATATCASEVVMVGNSEVNDIEPAVKLGMRSIRRAIRSASTSRGCEPSISSDNSAAKPRTNSIHWSEYRSFCSRDILAPS